MSTWTVDKGIVSWAVMMSNDRLPKEPSIHARRFENLFMFDNASFQGRDPWIREDSVTRLRSWEPGRVTVWWWLTRTGKSTCTPLTASAGAIGFSGPVTYGTPADIGFQIESLFGSPFSRQRDHIRHRRSGTALPRGPHIPVQGQAHRTGATVGLPRSKRLTGYSIGHTSSPAA